MLSRLIDFLLGMLRDDGAKVAFEADPQGTLARHGLRGVTGEDIRDARLIMADRGDIQATGHDWSGPRHADPVREIHHTTKHFEVRDIDQTLNVVNIDDRDTVINDSFNSNDNNDVDVDVVAIQDNDKIIQDNDQIVVEEEEDPVEESNEDEATTEEPGEEAEAILDDPIEPVEEPPVLLEEPVDPVEEEPDVDPAIV